MELIKFILEFMVLAIRKMAIFFIIGISFAALIKTFNLDKYLSKSLERKKLISVPLATMAGAFSPLCSCGVIPAIAALLISGVPLAPIMAFWVTSPLMNPETFTLTYGILGKEIALARLVSTVFIGLLGGYITFFLSKKGFLDGPIIKEYTNVDKNIGINCCKDKKVRKSLVFIRNFKDMALFVGKYLVLAFFLEALTLSSKKSPAS